MGLTPVVPPQKPSLAWRVGSSMIMGLTGLLSKGFLYGLNDVEVIGIQRFLDLLESRRDVEKRRRGLITVSNHISILDDPLIWGVLPLKYAFDPANLRWSLAAHDICFKNPILTRFFNLGQTLPTYRFKHSPLGGLFQPTISDAIRLLSSPEQTVAGRGAATIPSAETSPSSSSRHRLHLHYPDSPYRPWARHAWVHVFPEGCVHQHPERGLRYFKWGVARLVLECDDGLPPPDVVPVFVDGTDRIMAEDRGFPRFLPRVGQKVRVVFGEPLDFEAAFGDLRRRWRALVVSSSSSPYSSTDSLASAAAPTASFGLVDLEHGEEARAIRIEVARRLRDEVLKLRRRLGYPDEDEAAGLGLAETWAREPGVGYTYRSKVDNSVVNQK